MAKYTATPTGVERTFDSNEFIVSKTDLKGRLTYVNKVFMDIADYNEAELIGQPHSIIRHPDMPRSVFHLLWGTVQQQKEIFAYVVNMTKSGDHYWVLAHVTPSYNLDMQHVGYHSNRRVPCRQALDTIIPLYKELRSIESKSANARTGMENAVAHLQNLLTEKGVAYDEFIFDITT